MFCVLKKENKLRLMYTFFVVVLEATFCSNIAEYFQIMP